MSTPNANVILLAQRAKAQAERQLRELNAELQHNKELIAALNNYIQAVEAIRKVLAIAADDRRTMGDVCDAVAIYLGPYGEEPPELKPQPPAT